MAMTALAPLPTDLTGRLLDLIPMGRAHAVPARVLARRLGTSERRVRALVSELRRRGYPIASTPHEPAGFYWPASREEAEECSTHLWSRVREQAAVARDFDRAAEARFRIPADLEQRFVQLRLELEREAS